MSYSFTMYCGKLLIPTQGNGLMVGMPGPMSVRRDNGVSRRRRRKKRRSNSEKLELLNSKLEDTTIQAHLIHLILLRLLELLHMLCGEPAKVWV